MQRRDTAAPPADIPRMPKRRPIHHIRKPKHYEPPKKEPEFLEDESSDEEDRPDAEDQEDDSQPEQMEYMRSMKFRQQDRAEDVPN